MEVRLHALIFNSRLARKLTRANLSSWIVNDSVTEAANYIMTYKAFEHKPPDMLKERVQKDYPSQLQNALTSVKGVNKTDVITLSTNFGVSVR